jgi:LPXTG-site transpeptidase (sortase) family protein
VSPTLRRGLSWAAVVAGLALAAGLALWLSAETARTDRAGGAANAGGSPAQLDPGPGGTGTAPPRPRLEIPAIDVAAHAVDLGLERDGSLEVPKRYDEVGLWKRGPEPGERGPAVVAGHVDSKTAPAVFFKLRELRRGDRVRWEGENGVTERFVVTRTEEHPKADFPTRRVYGETRRAELRLVTCSGPADASGRRSVNNLIVFARKL